MVQGLSDKRFLKECSIYTEINRYLSLVSTIVFYQEFRLDRLYGRSILLPGSPGGIPSYNHIKLVRFQAKQML